MKSAIDETESSVETLATPFGPFTFEVTSEGKATLVSFKELALSKPVRRRPKTEKRDKDNSGFTLKKLSSFLGSWREMIKEGTVSDEVYEYRKTICAGVEGLNPPCVHNRTGDDGVTHYCGGCGCGSRKHAILYIDGKPADESIRLHMPNPNCPIGIISKMPGSGDLKNVGGRLKQTGLLVKSAVDEMKNRHGLSTGEISNLKQRLMT